MGTGGAVALVLLTVGLTGAQANLAGAADADQLVLELRVVTHAALDPANLEAARRTTHALLASADIQTVWRVSTIDDACDNRSAAPFVIVHLFPTTKSSDPSISGEAMRAPGTAIPIALVYVRRSEELVQIMLRSPEGYSNPALSTLTTGHLVGLTIAHEVGHLFGLRHTSAGVMKPHLTLEDVVATRTSRLVFLPGERQRMRRALRADTAERSTSRPLE